MNGATREHNDMIRLGAGPNGFEQGKTFCGCAVQEVTGGYMVRFGENRQHTGFVDTSEKLVPNKELLFKVVGYRNGKAVLHPVFAGYR